MTTTSTTLFRVTCDNCRDDLKIPAWGWAFLIISLVAACIIIAEHLAWIIDKVWVDHRDDVSAEEEGRRVRRIANSRPPIKAGRVSPSVTIINEEKEGPTCVE